MKSKNLKRYLTISSGEIDTYIRMVMKARNMYISERKPVDDVNELLCKLFRIRKKLRA